MCLEVDQSPIRAHEEFWICNLNALLALIRPCNNGVLKSILSMIIYQQESWMVPSKFGQTHRKCKFERENFATPPDYVHYCDRSATNTLFGSELTSSRYFCRHNCQLNSMASIYFKSAEKLIYLTIFLIRCLDTFFANNIFIPSHCVYLRSESCSEC
jgi:hypothetical protein